MVAAHGFFASRRALILHRNQVGGGKHEPAQYQNVPKVIAVLISRRVATLHELDTIYGVQDAYDMLEIVAVDDYNASQE